MPNITTDLDLFSPKKQELETMASKYSWLTISGIDDKEGLERVHKARMELRNARVAIEKTRKEYTRQFDEAKKTALDKEKELVAIISPVEDALALEEDKIEKAKEEIKEQARRAAAEKLNSRVQALAQYNSSHDLFALQNMDDAVFATLLESTKTTFDAAEIARKEAEATLTKEREELAQLRAQKEAIENAQKEIENAQREIEQKKRDEEMRKQHEIDLENARKATEEKTRIETEARIVREAEEAKAKKEEEDRAFEKTQKFKKFLEANGVTAENKHEYKTEWENGFCKLWKLVWKEFI